MQAMVQLEQTGNIFHMSYFIKDQRQLNFIEVSMTTGRVVHFLHVYGRIKKAIHFLTTKHIAVADTSVTRTARDGSQQDISCPPCLPDYQEFM